MVWRNRRFVILLLAVVAAIQALAGQAAAAPAPIPLSTALDMLESGAATSATLDTSSGGTSLVIRLNGVVRSTVLPAGLTERVIESARQGGVPLRVQAPAATPAVVEPTDAGIDIEGLVQTWGPLVLLAGLVL